MGDGGIEIPVDSLPPSLGRPLHILIAKDMSLGGIVAVAETRAVAVFFYSSLNEDFGVLADEVVECWQHEDCFSERIAGLLGLLQVCISA